MGYIEAIKAGIILLVVSLYTFGIWHTATQVNDARWLKKEETSRKVIEAQAKQAMNDTIESARLAQQIEVEKNDKQQIIDKASDDLRVALNSVPKRSACRSSNVPKADNSGVPFIGTPDTTELSAEFKEFLISDSKRADSVGLYASTAHEWVMELCRLDAACAKKHNFPVIQP